ncbi:Cro/Cl family transcriptional regulator [Oceanobacillus sp. E9]|uniref:Transcriptional regulator n=1 Tax=Oceanobacillus kimchii TaxID=746691 RepID=A0ABQ5TP27_9BACI|nr:MULTISPECIES: helix-turn-helix transcriptional regulator [Oceanobacillus]MBT2599605.1 helix-turn-helix transcriptional regulator [Oceanobacillus sp. ISL-74]OEH56152.1 Cro/Cl family transcriptional regulator [Oceanobacillus sp. E9]GLO67830.1 transcriptional regulator [Oceanobacillus kimchii]
MINRVKLTRMERGITQQQLAARTGITRQTIGLIEKGQYNPTLQLCIKIAKVLEVTLDDLFWEENNS